VESGRGKGEGKQAGHYVSLTVSLVPPTPKEGPRQPKSRPVNAWWLRAPFAAVTNHDKEWALRLTDQHGELNSELVFRW
jgi:hypothetical protein